MKNVDVQYDGGYPNLCRGRLVITIDDKVWDFGQYNLHSGGCVWFSDNYRDEHIDSGPWSVDEWPDEFPEADKDLVLDAINSKIIWGCCGGCI